MRPMATSKLTSKSKHKEPRRSQAQRRADTSSLVLEAATRLFGEKGYELTTIEDIAAETNLTIRPIYHYFGNKKQLFQAVVENQELRLAEILSRTLNTEEADGMASLLRGWQAFSDLSNDQIFRQIVLIDSPNILGRERWAESSVVLKSEELLAKRYPQLPAVRLELISRMVIASLAEAALMLAQKETNQTIGKEIEKEIEWLFQQFVSLVKPD